MDLFSLTMGTGANAELTQSLLAQSQLVNNSLSDETRNTLALTSAAIMASSPQATRQQVERAKTMMGGILNDKQIESLLNVFSLQTSNMHTARTTLAHPLIAKMHELGQTDAYGETYNATRNELLYNRIKSGFSDLSSKDNSKFVVTNFADNCKADFIKDYNNLTVIEKQVIHRNHNTAIFAMFEDGEDVGSVHNGTF